MILRALGGAILIATGIGLALLAPAGAMMNGVVYLNLAVAILSPWITVAWRLLVIPILFVIGASLLFSALGAATGRTPIPGKRIRIVAALAWGVSYTVYMLVLTSSGLVLALDEFEFGQPGDLIYLLLLGFFIAAALRLTIRPRFRADVIVTMIGLIGGSLLSAYGFWYGPNGLPVGHPLQIAGFIAFPISLLAPIGILAMAINLLLSLGAGIRQRAIFRKA